MGKGNTRRPANKSTDNSRTIRDPAFAARLTQACDGHPHVPAKHNGRLTWIQRELQKRFALKVSIETVRKWFAGEAKPRPNKLERLAQILEIDTAWLSLGIDPSLLPRERKMRSAMVDGAVNVVAGLIQMDGGTPAFPEAEGKNVDLHAIIKGAKYDLHVCLGECKGKSIRFAVPVKYADLLILGIIRRGFTIEILEINADLIEAGTSHGGSIEVVIDEGEMRKRKIESFAQRI